MAARKESKRERRRLARLEDLRRQEARAEACPLSRDEFETLFVHVAERVFEEGHDDSFSLSREWLLAHGDADATLSFLHAQGVRCDWDLLISADPFKLFGPTAERLARMPLDEDDLRELLDSVRASVEQHGCSNKLTHTQEWLDAHEWPIATTTFCLLAQGGGCDCEVVYNVDPGNIYPGAGNTVYCSRHGHVDYALVCEHIARRGRTEWIGFAISEPEGDVREAFCEECHERLRGLEPWRPGTDDVTRICEQCFAEIKDIQDDLY